MDITFRVGMKLAEVEKEMLVATLRYHNGNKQKTAETLGVSLKTVYNLIHKYKLGGTREYVKFTV